MATILKSIVSFTGLAINAPVSLPHTLNINGAPKVPQFIGANGGGFAIAADSAAVTVTRTTGGPDVDVYSECWHSIEAAVPPGVGTFLPFVLSGGDGIPATPVQTFVFQPGGTAGANVYTDWQTLMTAIGLTVGVRSILFDDTFESPCVIPAGTWNLDNVILRGLLFRHTFAQIDEGAILQAARQFDGSLYLTFVGTTPPMTDLPHDYTLLADRGCVFRSTLAPMMRLSALAPGEGGLVVLRDGSHFENVGAPVLDVPLVGTSAVVVAIGSFIEIQSNTISGVAGTSLLIGGTANTPFGVMSVDQPGFLGTVTFLAAPSRYNVSGVITSDVPPVVGTVTRLDPSGGGFALTLPPAFNNSGQSLILKNITTSADTIKVLPSGSDTIDGLGVLMLASDHATATLVSDGISDWMIV